MAISAKDLAQKLDISAATVSMVLNHKEGISPATRDRVLDGAKKYGYDLSKYYAYTEDSYSVGFINYKKTGHVIADTPFFSELTEGISNACKANRMSLSVNYIYGTDSINEQLAAIMDNNYSCIILLATEMSFSDFEPFYQLSCPVIVLDCYYDEIQLDCVLINNIRGAFLATSHLIQQGFRNIGYLKSSDRIANFEERADGYYKALRYYGLEHPSCYVQDLTPSMEGAYHDMQKYLEGNPPLAEAYFVDNDLIAAGALRAFQEAGIKMPEEVSMIGFDNIPICSFLTPALSTMHVDKGALGSFAVDLALQRLTGVSSSATVKLEVSPSLIVRESVSLHS